MIFGDSVRKLFPHATKFARTLLRLKSIANFPTVPTATTATTATDVTNGIGAWPVGSVFIAVVATNPNTLLGGGTWAAFGAGRVLVGLDAGQAEFDVVEEVGGSKTHALTIAEMPAHAHDWTGLSGSHFPVTNNGYVGAAGAVKPEPTTQSTTSTGGNGAHNNLQPYIVCYFWKRTA